MRAFSDVRQVIAISTVGTPLDSALATPGVARLKQNIAVARSFRLVVHDSVGVPSATRNFGFIVRLLGFGDLLAKCMNLRWRHRVRPNAEHRCNGSPGSRFNQLVRRLSPLNLGTISLTQRTILKAAPPPDWAQRRVERYCSWGEPSRRASFKPRDHSRVVEFEYLPAEVCERMRRDGGSVFPAHANTDDLMPPIEARPLT